MKNAYALIGCLLTAGVAAQPPSPTPPEDRGDAQHVVAMTAEEAYAAGLLDRPAGKLVIPIDELGSKQELIDKITKHAVAAAAQVRAGLGTDGVRVSPPVMPPGFDRVLDAVEAGDDESLREALSEVTGRPVPQLRPTAEQRRLHDETAVYSPPRILPADDVLDSMRPDRVAALDAYRHLLDDRWDLIHALNNGGLDAAASAAARVFLSKSRPAPPPPTMPPEMEEQIRLAHERGWAEVDFPSRGAALARDAARMEDLPQSPLAAFDADKPVTATSRSFAAPDGRRVDVVEDTSFGGVLYAEKSAAAGVLMHNPTLRILGHDASVSIVRHADGVWATTVYAFDGAFLYEVTVEKKLEGEERAEFVRMATAMIEEDLSRFPDEE